MQVFIDNQFVYIYFFYGMAFFALGLALLLEARRATQLGLSGSFGLLSIFGLMHSLHEFVEMFILISGKPASPGIQSFTTIMLAGSFLPLIAYGLQGLSYSQRAKTFPARMTILAAVGYLTALALVELTYKPDFAVFQAAGSALARYMLGVPGGFLAGITLLKQRRNLGVETTPSFALSWTIAGLALIWYGGIGQAFPGESIIFPSMYVNAEMFRIWFGFPVQVLRGSMAVILAIGVIRGMRVFEQETERRLTSAKQAERDLQAAARELVLLYEASKLMTSTYDLETLMQASVERIVQIIEPVTTGLIVVPDSSGTQSMHLASHGEISSGTYFSPDTKLPEYIRNQYKDPQIHWLDPDGQDISDQIAPQQQAGSKDSTVEIRRALLPLETRQRVVGSILLETAADGPYLTLLEVPTIVILTHQLAIAIENAGLVLQLRQRDARRAELLQRATAAQEAERKRIARELHDETGQALTALAMSIRGVSKMLERSPDEAASHLQQLQDLSTNALNELRHLISDLRPSHLDDLGLMAALRWYSEQVQKRYGLPVMINVTGEERRVAPEAETMLFRIVQESLTNVVKHAEAEHAWVYVIYEAERICVSIQDDGKGFKKTDILEPGAGKAWGLLGIQERAVLVGADLEIDSEPDKGTTIWVSVRQNINTDNQDDQTERRIHHA